MISNQPRFELPLQPAPSLADFSRSRTFALATSSPGAAAMVGQNQLYRVAFERSVRDHELNKLFNADFYEI